ncbi:MAG: hypothetical protein HC905_03310 [Bacteroidales bacterium]|nr:hypothetical protein [Bacteroidales bacterium]
MQHIDVNLFELVFTNIIQNASDAITSGGLIHIRTNNNLKSVIITNNGEPITSDIQQQLFTPFFTTKKTGQGIGLTLTREILQSHGCRFSLQTLPNGLSEFSIIFV